MDANSENQEIATKISDIIQKKCLPSVIDTVASAKYTDLNLLYNLLLECGDTYFKYIKYYLRTYRMQPRKLKDFATVGLKLLDFHNDQSYRHTLHVTVLTCDWWKKLNHTNDTIPYEEFFKATKEERLEKLIERFPVDLILIKEYCIDFSLDVQIYYRKFLKRYVYVKSDDGSEYLMTFK